MDSNGADSLGLIPAPKQACAGEGFFDFRRGNLAIRIPFESEPARREAEALGVSIRLHSGGEVPVLVSDRPGSDTISLLLRDPDSPSEAYRLAIREEGVIVEGDGPAGLHWGVQTLLQIIRLRGAMPPCLEIADVPDFAHRGFYHDVTRGKVPTLPTLKSLAEKLSSYKINQLQLYIEHSYAFAGIPELWAGKDPLTAGEIRELDAFCRRRYIDLVPSLSTFGHLYELLRLKRFEHLNELDKKASELPHNLWDRMAHYTIDVSREESFRLIRSMLDEFLPLFTSRYCNICCDETFDLGKGKNRRSAEAAGGTGRLYAGFVKQLMGVVREHGRTPMLWGDVVLQHPDIIPELGGDAVFLNWGYGADVTEDATRAFAKAGVRYYSCPGVQGWSRFVNNLTAASKNIRGMTRYGARNGAAGILTTDWGDCGHVNFLANSFHGMALGAALSWNVSSYGDDGRFDTAFSTLEWGETGKAAGGLLRELGDLCFYHFGNMYAWAYGLNGLWNKENEVREAGYPAIEKNFRRAGELHDLFAGIKASPDFSGDPRDMDEFIWSADAVRWTLALCAFKLRYEFGREECPPLYDTHDLLARGAALVAEFERLWMKRNKKSELKNVTDTFEKIFGKIAAIHTHGRCDRDEASSTTK